MHQLHQRIGPRADFFAVIGRPLVRPLVRSVIPESDILLAGEPIFQLVLNGRLPESGEPAPSSLKIPFGGYQNIMGSAGTIFMEWDGQRAPAGNHLAVLGLGESQAHRLLAFVNSIGGARITHRSSVQSTAYDLPEISGANFGGRNRVLLGWKRISGITAEMVFSLNGVALYNPAGAIMEKERMAALHINVTDFNGGLYPNTGAQQVNTWFTPRFYNAAEAAKLTGN